jgi:hypothetical protein
MKARYGIRLAAWLAALVIAGGAAEARVSVSTAGNSNGTAVNSANGPKKINTPARCNANGGSIKDARAKSVFTKKQVKHGNKVVAKSGIAGDALPTHVDANSVFAGTAKFIADTPGGTVNNFTIDIGIDGVLRCKSPVPNLPPGNAIAGVAVDVVVDGVNRFAGTAIQDGNGLFAAGGALAGAFTQTPNQAEISSRSFPINLGTLTDGQRLQFFFIGSTLVSFAPDLPIDFAAADFYNTSTFKAAPAQGGKIEISSAAKKVKVYYVTVTPSPPTYALFIESADAALLADIQPGSVKVAVPAVGYFGTPSVFDATAAAPGDIDADGVPDVVIDVTDPQFDTVALSSNTVIVYAVTNGGVPLLGTLRRTAP